AIRILCSPMSRARWQRIIMVLIVVLNDANRIPKCEKNKKIQAEIKLLQLGKHGTYGQEDLHIQHV
ncbi:hypothetical protein, partial [Escherichia coli]|uniref:hypothetical protein n=1 Tax=Escherichia coli TaxID=562 RepID=UPI0024A79647